MEKYYELTVENIINMYKKELIENKNAGLALLEFGSYLYEEVDYLYNHLVGYIDKEDKGSILKIFGYTFVIDKSTALLKLIIKSKLFYDKKEFTYYPNDDTVFYNTKLKTEVKYSVFNEALKQIINKVLEDTDQAIINEFKQKINN